MAAALGSKEHLILTLDLRLIGGSALTGEIAVPKGRTLEEIESGIPVTYAPARNTIFLAHALAWAEVRGAEDVFFGASILDHSGYPDCRPEYAKAFERMANLATKAGVEGKSKFKIHTPVIRVTKAEIIQTAHAMGVDFSLTWLSFAKTSSHSMTTADCSDDRPMNSRRDWDRVRCRAVGQLRFVGLTTEGGGTWDGERLAAGGPGGRGWLRPRAGRSGDAGHRLGESG